MAFEIITIIFKKRKSVEDYIKLGKAVLDIVKHGVPFKFAEEGEGATHAGEGSS